MYACPRASRTVHNAGYVRLVWAASKKSKFPDRSHRKGVWSQTNDHALWSLGGSK